MYLIPGIWYRDMPEITFFIARPTNSLTNTQHKFSLSIFAIFGHFINGSVAEIRCHSQKMKLVIFSKDLHFLWDEHFLRKKMYWFSRIMQKLFPLEGFKLKMSGFQRMSDGHQIFFPYFDNGNWYQLFTICEIDFDTYYNIGVKNSIERVPSSEKLSLYYESVHPT